MENILVTAVGGGVGQSVVKALQETPYRIVGVDSEPSAAGLHGVPTAYVGHAAVDPGFTECLLEICRTEKCALIFAGLDAELIPLAENRARFETEGIVPVVSSPEVIRICDDKLATCEFLTRHGFPSPPTCLLADLQGVTYPVVLKPRRGGTGAKATYLARNAEELEVYRPLLDPDNCVAQEYTEGDEYTCGTVGFEGRCFGVIAMRRVLRGGDTYKAFVERNERVETVVRDVVEALKPFGPCNVQLRLKGREPHVFEINARCSGTTGARALAGFNEPKMVADYIFYGKEPRYAIREICILRYWQEIVVAKDRIEKLAAAGQLSGGTVRL